MRIDILLTPPEIQSDRVEGCTIIVIDVFRATSCITTAIASGACELFPVTTIDEALELRRLLAPTKKLMLGGERKTVKIEGFDLDNSPMSYSAQIVSGATIVMSTTNGTRALQASAQAGAAEIFVASLLNATAAARKAAATGRDVVIVCAGRQDRFTIEDALCAGMIAGIIDHNHTCELSDIAWTMADFYDRYRQDLRPALRRCEHYNRILNGGLADDVTYCLQRDVFDVVPRLDISTGSIRQSNG